MSAPPSVRPKGRNWLTDFEWGLTGLTVKKTGARIRFTPALLREVYVWLRFFVAVRFAPREPGPRFTAAFTPDRARPWYMIWPTLRLAGARFTTDPAKADLVVLFDDVTVCDAPPPPVRAGQRTLNFACRDISKSAVGAAFAQVFGYAVSVDPETHHGPAVEKSEINGAHDGAVIQCPAPRRPGRSYQREIRNLTADGRLAVDLRTTVVAAKPACVFIKRRPVETRFSNANADAALVPPDAVFTKDEQTKIAAFAAALGLEYGGLDVLRDTTDGRLYIVDANKTDLGPTRTLPVAEQVRACRILARALRAFLDTPPEAAP